MGEKNGKNVICVGCGKEIYRTLFKLNNSTSGEFYCTKQCRADKSSRDIQGIINSLCEYCGSEFHSSPGTIRRFCTRDCWRLGTQSKGPSYYRKFKVDTCRRCGFLPEDACQLDVHHHDGDKSNNTYYNLITLCANCHRLVHHMERSGLASDYTYVRDNTTPTQTLACAGGSCEL